MPHGGPWGRRRAHTTVHLRFGGGEPTRRDAKHQRSRGLGARATNKANEGDAVSPKQHISPGARVARRLAAGAAAALCALAALAPGAANAGTYHMYNCRVPGKETGTKGPWTFTANAFGISNLVAYDDCAVNGGSFGNYLPGGPMGGNSQSKLVLSKDNHRLSITAMKTWVNIDHATYVPYNSTAMAALWVDGAKVSEWDGSKPETPWPGKQYDYTGASGLAISPTPTQRVELSTTCPAGGGCQIYANPYKVYGVDTTLSEGVAPGANVAGPLTAPGAKTGTVSVEVAATDDDSGVRTIEALLDDQVVGSVDYARDWAKPLSEQKPGTCAFDSWRACDAARTVEMSVNTKLVPDGAYALTARVTDAAGNARTVQAAQPVSIDNVPDPIAPRAPDPIPGVPGRTGSDGPAGPNGADGANGRDGATRSVNGVNGSPGATVKAAFVATHRGIIRSAYGKKVLITGRLTAPNGRPITGARVAVLQQDKMVGAKMTPAGEVVTDKDGSFRYVTTAQRSRTIRFGYRANLQDTDFAQTTD